MANNVIEEIMDMGNTRARLIDGQKLPEDPQKKTAENLPGYEIQPETIDELNHLYFTCMELAEKYQKQAEKYQKQAEDWVKIMQICAKLGNQRKDAEKSGGGKDAEK